MPEAVCQMLTLLCTLVVACPIGTNTALRPEGCWEQRRTPATSATPTTRAEVACVSANWSIDGWYKCSRIRKGRVIASKTCRAPTKTLPDPGRKL